MVQLSIGGNSFNGNVILPTIITSLINDALEDITVSVQRVDDMDDGGTVYDGQEDTDSWSWLALVTQATPGLLLS